MKIKLQQIAHARSGDKGANSNAGLLFRSSEIYIWAKSHLTPEVIKHHFESIVKGNIIRYDMDNLLALNFILEDSLGGGGSESLINDAQGKTHGQKLLLLEIDLPDHLLQYVNQI